MTKTHLLTSLLLLIAVASSHAGTVYLMGPEGFINTDHNNYTSGIPQYHAPNSGVVPHYISQTYHNPFNKQ